MRTKKKYKKETTVINILVITRPLQRAQAIANYCATAFQGTEPQIIFNVIEEDEADTVVIMDLSVHPFAEELLKEKALDIKKAFQLRDNAVYVAKKLTLA